MAKFITYIIYLLCTAALAFGQLPTNFIGAGGAYNPYTRPVAAGWTTYARLLDQKSGTYMFTTEDITSSRQKPYTLNTSIRVGIGTLLKQLGPIKVFGIVDGGGSAAADTSGGAASGGSVVVFSIGHTSYHFVGGFRILKFSNVPGTPKLYELGFGKSW